ncbi:hydroxymethylglutaryl-CoA lyase [Phycisphaerales bacterium]|nr:hydroxymethylglutaryl-CoA lyase [Phycisphaerales bacterium]
MPERVRITDVSPRDGLQNEAGIIPTAEKVRLVELLCGTGVDEIEVTSFVSPKWVPQLGDATEVLRALNRDARGTPVFSVLVPNAKGMELARGGDAYDAIDKVAVFTAASETFSKRNTNATIAETVERFRPVITEAVDSRFAIRGYISTVIACPFEGPIPPAQVARVARMLATLGPDEIDLGDTIGAGTPDTVKAMLGAVADELAPDEREWMSHSQLTLHLHDTFGRAADCVKAALDFGIRSFDGSVAGLGGCPYASTPGRRAPGNISTELLVKTIHDAGYETGVDMERLAEAAAFAREIVAKSRGSVG